MLHHFLSSSLPSDTFFVPDPLSRNGIVAFPYTNSSILIQWFQPQLSYVSSPLLLQYTLYYTRNRDTNIEDRPVEANLTTSSSGIGSYILSGLSIGTEYYLTMSATNRAGTGQVLDSVLIVSTFGSGQSNHVHCKFLYYCFICTCQSCTCTCTVHLRMYMQ